MRDGGSATTNNGNASSKPANPLLVAMFIQHYHPFVGGAERQLQALTRVFPRFNVRSIVITRRLAGPGFPPREAVAGAPVYRIALRGGRILRSLSYTLGALRIVWRKRKQIAILHAHELRSPTTTAVFAKLLIRRPVVAKILGGGINGDVSILLATRVGRARLALFKRLVDRFICVSDEIAAQLLALGVPEKRLARIANGVDTNVYQPVSSDERTQLRAALNLPDTPLVLYAGRLAPEKGPRLLAAAWDIVHTQHPTARLLVLGEGPEREAFEPSGAQQVSLLGAQSNMSAYLQAADVFVLPSEREGLSNALLEAMSAGLACVATNVGGTPELIAHEETGLLVAPGDRDALATELSRALGDEALRQRLGAAARSFVAARYSIDASAAALAKLYATLAAR